ncbi:prolipoprotein diacylglyceryl transferase [Fulvivirga sp. 29W222]|uniref:Prolipoprotein diacylglyceryl transferase n=1 Tax=Fulvivirga marina TaxID=2494733 RepID=A0A937FW31_9BACT|nr:prolipoprotein diacylglyceryl transferase family protein [Fulvivirga marina]MBL6447205.1 prolipoprotein diacylglyceryl transferase [Fulvivirga marina]
MNIPFEPVVAGVPINVHLILEYIAFFVAFRYYLFLRRKVADHLSTSTRLTIILGATFGALIGSRIIGFMENPVLDYSIAGFIYLLNVKTIMGGLFGGLLGVEIAKWIIGEKQSSGDLFVLPITLGIFIGRIGCFLAGINEFTYGTETSFFMGMDLGDGVLRHPVTLYEIIYLAVLFVLFRRLMKEELENGILFRWFMLLYFGFRFFIEFIKPNIFYTLGLSSIQWLCVVCFIYYRNTLIKLFKHAY